MKLLFSYIEVCSYAYENKFEMIIEPNLDVNGIYGKVIIYKGNEYVGEFKTIENNCFEYLSKTM